MEAAATAAPVSAADARLRRGLALLERYRLVLAAASFGLGAGSFLLVEHGQALAQWIALLLVLNWLLIVSENTIGQRLARYRWARFSPVVLRYAMQAVHQQTFFFCLPFLFATTTWGSGQAVFTATVIAAALISMWDPLYYGVIAPSPTLHLALHALAMYLAMLTVPPLLWQLTTTQSLGIASVTIAVLSLPSLARLIAWSGGRRSLRGWALLLAAGAALGLFSWLFRAWVPPATLRLTQGIITTDVDPDARAPHNVLEQVPEATLRGTGLCAFTAISAPRGLHERIYHRWLHRGHEVTRIALPLSGGREDGYRAWSCKQVFPQDASGSWAVQVVTDAGQLIGVVRFEVVGGADMGK